MTLLTIDHDSIDHDSVVPPFEQLRTQVSAMTVTGELEAGQKPAHGPPTRKRSRPRRKHGRTRLS